MKYNNSLIGMQGSKIVGSGLVLILLGLTTQSIYAKSSLFEHPEMIPFMLIMVVSALVIVFISTKVSTLSRGQSFFTALGYAFAGLVLIGVVLYICIWGLIWAADQFDL